MNEIGRCEQPGSRCPTVFSARGPKLKFCRRPRVIGWATAHRREKNRARAGPKVQISKLRSSNLTNSEVQISKSRSLGTSFDGQLCRKLFFFSVQECLSASESPRLIVNLMGFHVSYFVFEFWYGGRDSAPPILRIGPSACEVNAGGRVYFSRRISPFLRFFVVFEGRIAGFWGDLSGS